MSDSPVLDISRFVRSQGVTTLVVDGEIHDPYFTGKALLCAHQLGLAVEPLIHSMLSWLLPRQQRDGRFARYCINGAGWDACRDADADDSMCAVVIHLISIVQKSKLIPAQWRLALERCQMLLARLRTGQGTYNVSPDLPVQLLMDNCEVYQALVALGERYQSIGRRDQARVTLRQAEALRLAIIRSFWRPDTAQYLVSSQSRQETAFYPDATAQLFPLLSGMYAKQGTPAIDLDAWRRQHLESWLSGASDHYPWGLMALAFQMAAEPGIARRWLKFAESLRWTDRWNILEEAIFQGLSHWAKA